MCLPQWAAKTIEVVGPNFGDVTVGRQTRSQKQVRNVSLMNRVLETCDPKTLNVSKGKR